MQFLKSIIVIVVVFTSVIVIDNYFLSSPTSSSPNVTETQSDNANSNSINMNSSDESDELVEESFSTIYILIIAFLIIILFTLLKLSLKLSNLNDEIETLHSNLEKKIDDMESKYENIQESLSSANKDNFNVIEFPKNLNDRMTEFTELITKYSKAVFKVINDEQKKSIEDIKDTMLTFRDMTNEKSNELNRYKEGYDFLKQKNIIMDLISLNSRIIDYKSKFITENNDTAVEYLNALSQTILSILDNNHIEEFSINLGENILEVDSCDAVDQTIPTDDEEKINTIAEIVSPGYRIFTDTEEYKIIKKIKVKVFSKNLGE